jgi:tetratricopeptide (TPR) repeat protein
VLSRYLNGGYQADAMTVHAYALDVARRRGDLVAEAYALRSLGTLHTRLGRFDEATEHYRLALAIFRRIGDRHIESWVLNGLGEAAHGSGRHADAVAQHTAALAIATDTGARDQQARAHAGPAHALGRSREHLERALALYTELELPEAEQIRRRLAT